MPVPRPYVTVVSGIPRSGTSLMMRMLEAGGIPALTDGRRTPDRHNPHGYFEDARASRLAQDSSWLAEARGKAVKIIYRLLPHLPDHLDYRILFMQRDLAEVFASQQDLLLSAGHPAAAQDPNRMIRALAADLEKVRRWLTRRSDLPHLDVPYAEVIANPGLWTNRIAQFLDGELDQVAMSRVVEPALYRHRK